MSHECPARGCTEAVEAGKLMCRDDWARVPGPLQQAVYRAWDHGRGRGSAAHRAAIAAAVRSVNGEPEPDCIHDLDPASCAVCNGAEKRAAASAKAARGPWFTAQYDGTCAGCGEPFEAGDRIRADGDGGWLCEDCGDG